MGVARSVTRAQELGQGQTGGGGRSVRAKDGPVLRLAGFSEAPDNASMAKLSSPHSSAHTDAHHARRAAIHKRVSRLAHWLDNAVSIPGTRFRFGLDSLIGLIPGLGDVAGMLLGGTILTEAYRAGAPNPLMLRMVGNLATDGLLGAVPVVGDLFDVAFRSHSRNARLLLDHLDEPPAATAGSRLLSTLILLLVPILFLAMLGLSVLGLVTAYRHFAS